MNTLFAILIDGMIYASWLFLVAAGLTVIYGVMRILNMAHGSFYAIGAYSAASLVGWYFNGDGDSSPYWSYALLLGCALVAGLVVGVVLEQGLLRFMRGRDETLMVIVTYALLLILEDVTKLLWGVDPYFAYQPYRLLGQSEIGDALSFANYDLSLVVVSIIVGLIAWYALNRTNKGRLLRAVIHDREVAMAMGVNVNVMFAVTFVIGSILGALAGALTAPAISVTPGIGIEVIVLAFAVVVVGGLGSIGGAAVGALLVGLTRSFAVHLAPEIELFVIYGVMFLVLAVRPQGLFGQILARKI
ncbi:amino acid/amide ABC transporter membrane protein 1 (HAAT family) [Paucimonas lemoignei]|uniref:Amino acid/amide ABC transporter membrane protein 1 (HAAT family) n=1 Tax=Paucimonas lemoignei TaxID=29443 RepID=A0A4R3HVC3_PAULE|nr:branched-chain amino acid ABC transporter permease [Paucimonas lemoignei]TCS37062.1 amino acid/amide ABC transporter membrane protein 1 (HAAT family) [Paucimonas lemoignei]